MSDWNREAFTGYNIINFEIEFSWAALPMPIENVVCWLSMVPVVLIAYPKYV